MKTTLTGILIILIAIGNAIHAYLQTGVLPDLAVLMIAISTGTGLIVAKDHNATNAPNPTQVARVVTPLLGLLCVISLTSCALNPLTGKREYVGPPISGKVCMTKNGVRYCVGSDGKVILIDADFKQVR